MPELKKNVKEESVPIKRKRFKPPKLLTVIFTTLVVIETMTIYLGFISINEHQKAEAIVNEMNAQRRSQQQQEQQETAQVEEEYTIDESLTGDLRYHCNDEEYNNLLRVVEAEVTGDSPNDFPLYQGRKVTEKEIKDSKIRIAQVILNRIEDSRFPNDINSVIFQKNAFSPVGDGRFYDVTVTEMTREAVDYALRNDAVDLTEYNGQRAMFFQMYYCQPNIYGELLFTDPVGHQFYTYR